MLGIIVFGENTSFGTASRRLVWSCGIVCTGIIVWIRTCGVTKSEILCLRRECAQTKDIWLMLRVEFGYTVMYDSMGTLPANATIFPSRPNRFCTLVNTAESQSANVTNETDIPFVPTGLPQSRETGPGFAILDPTLLFLENEAQISENFENLLLAKECAAGVWGDFDGKCHLSKNRYPLKRRLFSFWASRFWNTRGGGVILI